MASGASQTIALRRRDSGHNWGFKMQGGRDCGLPLFICAVNPKGLSAKMGLAAGDVVLAICGTPVIGWSQEEAKREMLRAGNEVDLTVQKAQIDVRDPAIRQACGLPVAGVSGGPQQRSELVEESINPHMNEGSKYRNVTPKTYKILEQQLATNEPPPSAMNSNQPAQQMRPVHAQQTAPPRGAAAAAAGGAKPSSIFDRKKQDRSDYLVASSNTIQKTFGEQ